MFFLRNSATSSNNEPIFSFRRLSISHDDTPTSSPRSGPISSSAIFFSAGPALLIASSDEPTSSFCRLSFSHDDTPFCWSCNAVVHGADFLVAYHVRRLPCTSCLAADFGHRFSGLGAQHPLLIPTLYTSCRTTDPSASLPQPPPLPFPPPPTPTASPTTTSSA